MIRITYIPEPASLPPLRQAELARLASRTTANPPTSSEVGDRYRIVAGDLWRMQFFKCCYCEQKIRTSFNDVEHFRPKGEALRQPGSDETYGYWWLAWTWENLLFSCPQCNRSGKNNAFPLAVGDTPLSPGDLPPGGEHPILIHPGLENPLEHIVYRPVRQASDGRELWVPLPRNGSERGVVCIRVLGLDNPELLELYTEHVVDNLTIDVQRLENLRSAGDTKEFERDWAATTRHRLRGSLPFAGLAHSVFEHYFPEPIRNAFGVGLPFPGIEL